MLNENKTGNRERPILVRFFVTEREKEIIRKRMALAKTKNMSAFLRKMAIDGMILNMDFSEIRRLCSHVGKVSGIINQIVKRVNSTERYYADDIEEIKRKQVEILNAVNQIGEKIL